VACARCAVEVSGIRPPGDGSSVRAPRILRRQRICASL
jgi:hypothetical protein